MTLEEALDQKYDTDVPPGWNTIVTTTNGKDFFVLAVHDMAYEENLAIDVNTEEEAATLQIWGA